MYRTLLVPLDGAPFAEQALALAAAVGKRSGASLHLVSVVTPLTAAYPEGVFVAPIDLEQEILAQRRAYLDGVADRLRAHFDGPIFPAVLEGEVAPALEAHAGRIGADLVVLATHGRGPLGRFWLGSVADELIRHLSLPVLLTRPHEEKEAQQPAEVGNVLLPLDGTELAEQILEPAVALAALWPQANLTLLRVIRPVMPTLDTASGVSAEQEAKHLIQQVQAIQQQQHAEARRYLQGVADRLRERGLTVHPRVAVEEQPAVAILREAETTGAGLIALATHGRRGLSRLILGSVADKVVRASPVPVLVQKPRG